MIGSRRGAAAVLQHLIDEGLDAEAVRRVRTPIGLDIGAETPEEIAVAIMAGLVQVRRGGRGGAASAARAAAAAARRRSGRRRWKPCGTAAPGWCRWT